MTRQYIGARYVPKFANPIEWDRNRSYEALTMVTYYGTTYTSKKPVPAVTDITNTEYWVVTGNYNAQVEQYRQEVAGVRTDVDAVEDRVDDMVDDIALLRTRSDFDHPICVRANKPHYIIIGDSYGVHSDERGKSWAEYLEEMLGLVVAKTNVEVTEETDCWDMCRGGEGFVGAGSSWGNWLDTIQNEYPAAYDKNRVTHIIIAGGYNDQYASTVDLRQAMADFNAYTRVEFPNARFYIFCIGTGLQDAGRIGAMWPVYSTYKECDSFERWTYCPGLEGILHNFANLYVDYHHPVPRGGIIVARSIKQSIFGGAPEIVMDRATFTPYSGEDYNVTVDGENQLVFCTGITGIDAYAYAMNNQRIDFDVAQNLVDTKIGTLPSSYFQTAGTTRGACQMMLCIKSDNTPVVIPVSLKIDHDGNVYLRRTTADFAGTYKAVVFNYGDKFWQNIYLA